MRKLFATTFIAFSSFLYIPCCAQFNTYHPFPDSNAYWRETTFWQATGCTREYVTAYKYFDYYVNGDTIVNGKTYFKVRTSGGYEDAPPCPPSIVWLDFDNFVCLLREDTLTKHVYASFAPTLGIDTLLYDFSLAQGDTLPEGYLTGNSDSTYVHSIDSILVGNSYRKQFIIAMHNLSSHIIFDSIIEGVGSSNGLLERIMPPFEGGSYMDCFGNSSMNFLYPNGDSCYRFILSVGNIINPVGKVSIYPNPSNGKFTIEITTNNEQGVINIEVYNVLGEKVYSQFNIQNSTSNINLTSQPNGVYLYRVITETGELVGEGKLIIQR